MRMEGGQKGAAVAMVVLRVGDASLSVYVSDQEMGRDIL